MNGDSIENGAVHGLLQYGGLTQAAFDRGYAPPVSGAIFSRSTQSKPRQG